MPNSFNRFDPMNQSMYLEYLGPSSSVDEILNSSPYMTNFPAGATAPIPNKPSGVKISPQPQKDTFYKNDGADDGKISIREKIKAFAKGGTYNMVRGMFCDKDGFSIKRTLLTATAATAIALTGPIGAAIAGGVGLIAALANFAKSANMANNAQTDQQAREAYEGFGEGTTTALLSLLGGFKGLKSLKNNFSSKFDGSFLQRLTKWKLPTKTVNPPPEEPPVVKPPVEEPPVVEEPIDITQPEETILQPKQLTGPQPQKALPSPEMVRARMEADGQIQLPSVQPKPKYDLGPIEQYYRTPESQFKIPEKYLNPTQKPLKVKRTYVKFPQKTPVSKKKLEIIEGSRSLIEQKLGKQTAKEYMYTFEKNATRKRVELLPEIFEYIKAQRIAARNAARANNNGVLPKGYKDSVQYKDAIDLYKVIQDKNSGYVRSLMKEGKLSLQEIVQSVKNANAKALRIKKYGECKAPEVDYTSIKMPTAEQNANFASPTAPMGKVPPEIEKPSYFPESNPTKI